ncbi:MAG: hypothetical protein JO166_19805 [Deltaproteobacteria bacterium]|nr:hypothetical protein [Deltaproteobacteria bacterium]
MKACLKPLSSIDEYYGTIIEILDGPYKGPTIKVWENTWPWHDDDLQPSDRELAAHETSRKEFVRRAAIGIDATPIDLPGRHYETTASHCVAELIIESLEQLTSELERKLSPERLAELRELRKRKRAILSEVEEEPAIETTAREQRD